MVYELPIDATHCPKGHKRLKRLYNQVGVIGTKATSRDWQRSMDTAMRDAYDHERPSTVPNMPSFGLGSREREISMPQGRKFVAPSRQELASFFGAEGQGRVMNEMEIVRERRRDPYSIPAMLHRQRGGPHPHIVGREP